MAEVTVKVETEINPTESEEKVKSAVTNIFANALAVVVPCKAGSVLRAEAQGPEALVGFRDLLRRDRVRAAARKVLFTGLEGKTITFFLNKQVALSDHISFSQETGESPLGPIKVTIHCQKPREIIDWLAPRTS